MPTVKANQTAIENLPPPDAKRFERYEVDGVDGLWVVVRQNGKRSFYARYQFTRNGKREFFEKKLGDVSTVKLAAARERAKSWCLMRN